MASQFFPNDDDLRRAYQDSRCRRLMGWPFEKAMAIPTIAIAVTNLARERATHSQPRPTTPSPQPALL